MTRTQSLSQMVREGLCRSNGELTNKGRIVMRRRRHVEPTTVAAVPTKTGRGTAVVVREADGTLHCSCGEPRCIHLATAEIANSAHVAVVDDAAPYIVVKNYDSETSPGVFYSVKRNRQTRALSCNCRGWILAQKKSGKPCWHVRDVEQLGL